MIKLSRHSHAHACINSHNIHATTGMMGATTAAGVNIGVNVVGAQNTVCNKMNASAGNIKYSGILSY